MAENYKHLYEQTKKMLTMYQDELIPGFRKQIEELEAKSKWIHVSERLPEEHGTFIVALYIRSRKRKYSDSATFDPVTKRWRTHLFWGKGMKITHWMLLPEPPKE